MANENGLMAALCDAHIVKPQVFCYLAFAGWIPSVIAGVETPGGAASMRLRMAEMLSLWKEYAG